MKHLLLVFIFLLPIEAIAQYDFGAIADIEQKKSENDETKRLATIAKKAEQARIAKQKANQRAKLAKQKQDIKNKAQQVILADKKADKNREQSYEDELRALNLQVMRAKADRTNDFIDADLAKSAASTDGLQADADRTRMSGTAEIKRAENPTHITVDRSIKVIKIED